MQPFLTQPPACFSAKPRSGPFGLAFLFWLLSASSLLAQMGFNSPAGVKPTQDVEFYSRNGFLVQQKYKYVAQDPSASVSTMSCVNPAPALTAFAGTLKDPSGDVNYTAGVSYSCTQTISLPYSISGLSVIGVEILFDDLDTELNADYVSFRDCNDQLLFYSGSILPPRIILPIVNSCATVTIQFVTNTNATVGRGFRLRWRTVLSEGLSDPSPIAFGRAVQYDVKDASFKAGYNNVTSNFGAIALGNGNTASGFSSVALGLQNTASGDYAIAGGNANTSASDNATAFGIVNKASGYASVAMGASNTASGNRAVAIGADNTASGNYSTALGNSVSTNGFYGAFIVGDVSATTSTSSTANHQYSARFAGGYRLFTNAIATIGASLAAGGNAWATISDSTKKERFRPVDGPALLRNIGAMKLGTWNYIGQRDQRHYGPMAQEFFARFGHDALGIIGCDTLLNSHDFTAVTFTGVQALVQENERLKAEITQLRAEARRTESRLDAIEALLPARKRPLNAARK
jgi:Head domain of trimeric autotransporter adhesin/Chaperone of endosialidase